MQDTRFRKIGFSGGDCGEVYDDEEAYFDFDSIPNCSFDDCFLSREAVAASTIACCVVQVTAITVNIVTIITIVTIIIDLFMKFNILQTF